MNGYEYIRNMTDMEISKTFWVGFKEAVQIRNSTKGEMILSSEVCPERLDIPKQFECRHRVMNCHECKRKFMEEEVPVPA